MNTSGFRFSTFMSGRRNLNVSLTELFFLCDNFKFVFSSLQIHAANDTCVLFRNVFRLICSNVRPLNLTEQMFLFSKQIAPRLISQKQLPLKKKTRVGKTLLPFSLSSSEDRYFTRNIQRQRGADSALLGLGMTS